MSIGECKNLRDELRPSMGTQDYKWTTPLTGPHKNTRDYAPYWAMKTRSYAPYWALHARRRRIKKTNRYAPYWATTTKKNKQNKKMNRYAPYWATTTQEHYAPYWAIHKRNKEQYTLRPLLGHENKRRENYLKQLETLRQCRECMRTTVKTIREYNKQSEKFRDN